MGHASRLATRLWGRRGLHMARGNCNQNIDEIARQIKEEANNVVVMVGAGLSTASGIPDFRSPGTGIYYNLRQYNLPYPEAIFDIDYFRHTPAPFFTWAKEFFPGVNYKPNIAHFFLKLLDDKGRLVRVYTQNIDGLESLAGLHDDRIVAAHGHFSSASCIRCSSPADIQTVKTAILDGKVPQCKECKDGVVKPDIVFFGEMLPERFWMHQEDTVFSDYLMCIGTSLEVYPFAGISDAVPHKIPRLLINRDLVGSFGSREQDCLLIGDLVKNIELLAEKLGWRQDLEDLMKA